MAYVISGIDFDGQTTTYEPTSGSACIWFDCTNCRLKATYIEYTGSSGWSLGPDYPLGSCWTGVSGIQNAALVGDGCAAAPTLYHEFDGVSWIATDENSLGRVINSGAQTDTVTHNQLGVGILSYNGIVWSSMPDAANTLNCFAVTGPAQRSFRIGGGTPTVVTCTELYDGSSWNSGPSINVARRGHAASGTQNASLIWMGSIGGNSSCVEEYDGSSWSTGTATPSTGTYLQGSGTQNIAFSFGCNIGVCSSICWNGTSWSSQASSPLPSYLGGVSGAYTQGITVGSSSCNDCTQLFTATGSLVICVLAP